MGALRCSPHPSSRRINSDPKFYCADGVGKTHLISHRMGSHSFPTTNSPVCALQNCSGTRRAPKNAIAFSNHSDPSLFMLNLMAKARLDSQASTGVRYIQILHGASLLI